MSKRNRNCVWHCGRETKNISRICDYCWADREAIYETRKTREAEAEKKPRDNQTANGTGQSTKGKITEGIAYQRAFTLN